MIFRRRKKLYFQNTVSKFPTIIFVASIIIGGFFLFKIIATLVKESENVNEFAPIETKTEIQKETETTPSPEEVVQKPAVKKPVKKPTEITVPKEPVKTSQLTEFYTIQVATFSDTVRTENLAGQLKENKYSPIYIKTREKLFEVCVGHFSSSKEGQEVLSKIRKSFRDAFIRKIQPPFEEK